MRSEDILLGLIVAPVVSVSDRSVTALLVSFLDSLPVLGVEVLGAWGVSHEERIVRVSRGMLLRLEERVEVPESTLHELVGGHFFETHLE